MKKIIILLFLFSFSLYPQSQNAFLFRIEYQDIDSTQTALVVAKYLMNKAAEEIMDEFPCTKTLTYDDIVTMLNHDRQRALLGADVDGSLQNIANAMGMSGYLVVATVIRAPAVTSIGLNCMDMKKAKTIYRNAKISKDGNYLDVCDEVIKEFVEEVAYWEPCAYKGKIKLKVHEDRNKKDQMKIPTICNGMMANIRMLSTVKSFDEHTWELNKIRVKQADGTMKWDVKEEYHNEEHHPCYDCEGVQGARSFKQDKTVTSHVEKIPAYKGDVCARVSIEFSHDDTYTIHFKVASAEGSSTTVIKEEIDGVCNNPDNKTQGPFKRSVPLDYKIGPFKGTPMDKKLFGKEHVDMENSNEVKSYYEYEFELTRD